MRNRGRWTRWWGQFLYRKQNWRYFCACALKKSSKYSANVFRQKSYSPVTGNGDRRSERRGQIFDRKLVSRRFCACAVKICPKLANCVVVLSNRHNFHPFTRNRGRWTRWWGQFLHRKQNWRYVCACALKKSPKHSENVFRQKSYLPVTGNLRRRSEWRGQIFDRKFLNSCLCACAVKICPKLAYNVKSPKF